MSAENLEAMKLRFNAAYAAVVGKARDSWRSGPIEGATHNMKVEFDAALTLVRDATAEIDWVRNVLAEHGYSGPLTETSCPLREWLAPTETEPVPEKFTEYCVDVEDGGRHLFYSRADAANKMDQLVDRQESYKFSTEQFTFADEWKFACSMLSQGQGLSASSLHALKLGIAAGMVPSL